MPPRCSSVRSYARCANEHTSGSPKTPGSVKCPANRCGPFGQSWVVADFTTASWNGVSPVPLPAVLPIFATGLGALDPPHSPVTRPTQLAHKKEGCPHRNGTAPRQRFVSAAHTELGDPTKSINALTVIWFPQNVRAAPPRPSVSTLAVFI